MMKEKSNYNDLTVEELKAIFLDLCKEIYGYKNELSQTRKMEKPHLLRKSKRDRARVLTAMRQKSGVVAYEG